MGLLYSFHFMNLASRSGFSILYISIPQNLPDVNIFDLKRRAIQFSSSVAFKRLKIWKSLGFQVSANRSRSGDLDLQRGRIVDFNSDIKTEN